MSLQSIDIFGFQSGVNKKNKKPFLFLDDAMQELENAYCWREEIKKREGLKLIGRLRRDFTAKSIGLSSASPWTVNILSTIGIKGNITAITNFNPGAVTTLDPHNLITGKQVIISGVGGMTQVNGQTVTIASTGANTFTIGIDTLAYGVYTSGGLWSLATEPNAEVSPGSVVIVIGAITFTDQGNGLLTSVTPGNSGTINYLTGEVVLTHTAGAGVASTASFGYYPGLPVMGILQREKSGINDEQTIWFDTVYAYVNNGLNFVEYLPGSAKTWDGSDSDFFWGANVRGSEASQRLFFVTNFVPSAGSPMRYSDNSTWTDFAPVVGGANKTQVLPTVAAGAAAYGPQLITPLPIVKGTLVVTVSYSVSGEETDIIFRDTPKNGTLVATGLNVGTINYATGAIALTFNPVLPGTAVWEVNAEWQQAGTTLFSARILIPYYGRLVALNTWEGQTVGSSVNLFSRARFSQIGNPVQEDAWRSDVFGKGGFVDAPTNEEIISAIFYKNTLIVFFEKSTWRLQYLGEYGIPFVWERISSDFGSESTFSTVLFDTGVLAVGDRAIVGSSAGDVQRIDLQIPDQVYDFRNSDNGPKRVYGIRDFKKELVYWAYPENNSLQLPTQYFPNKSIVYNYRNNTYAYFRNTVTAYGNYQSPANITWDRLDVFWDDYNVFWDDEQQEGMPLIASGNQQGFCHFYGYDDTVAGLNSTMTTIDQESLCITNVTVGATTVLEIINHNLASDEFIYVKGLIYINGSVAGSTNLNDRIYRVQVIDKDNVTLFLWSPTNQAFYSNFTTTNVGTYFGGGVAALFPNINIQTKDFNPAKINSGENIKTSYIDFLFDASSPSPINIQMIMNTTANAKGNVVPGSNNLRTTNVETANSKTGYIYDVTSANPPVVIISSPNHALLTGDIISPQQVGGSTEINGKQYTVTFLTANTFSIEEAAISTYTGGGFWQQTKQQYFTLSAKYAWHRFFSTCFGQFFSLKLSYNDEQMSQLSTHQQNFVLNAMKIWYRPGGRNIFGK
jgi:hypothetical protein